MDLFAHWTETRGPRDLVERRKYGTHGAECSRLRPTFAPALMPDNTRSGWKLKLPIAPTITHSAGGASSA